jgi:hypothetical protein
MRCERKANEDGVRGHAIYTMMVPSAAEGAVAMHHQRISRRPGLGPPGPSPSFFT